MKPRAEVTPEDRLLIWLIWDTIAAVAGLSSGRELARNRNVQQYGSARVICSALSFHATKVSLLALARELEYASPDTLRRAVRSLPRHLAASPKLRAAGQKLSTEHGFPLPPNWNARPEAAARYGATELSAWQRDCVEEIYATAQSLGLSLLLTLIAPGRIQTQAAQALLALTVSIVSEGQVQKTDVKRAVAEQVGAEYSVTTRAVKRMPQHLEVGAIAEFIAGLVAALEARDIPVAIPPQWRAALPPVTAAHLSSDELPGGQNQLVSEIYETAQLLDFDIFLPLMVPTWLGTRQAQALLALTISALSGGKVERTGKKRAAADYLGVDSYMAHRAVQGMPMFLDQPEIASFVAKLLDSLPPGIEVALPADWRSALPTIG